MRFHYKIGCFFLILSGLLAPAPVTAQKSFPPNDFRPPVDFPIFLSGTFGELRSGHLHAGIDIKTGGVQGKKVYAIADGYVSRIGITLGGYGKALYITHPDGYVSVYGHLKKFNPRIQRYVKAEQYRRQRFTVQIFPPKDSLKVKKGEVIAYSGNTGGSLGPHLHFEIRNTKTQHPVNPLLFRSIRVKDDLPPKIARLSVYPVFPSSRINGKHDTLLLPVAGHGKNCYLKNMPVIDATGPISFGLRAFDVMNGTTNKNGVYRLQLYKDSTLVFAIEADSLSFKTTRFANSLTDYNYFEKTGRHLIRVQRDTNNRLPVYKKDVNHGVFVFNDTLPHRFTFVTADVYGNTAVLKFTVKDSPPPAEIHKIQEKRQGHLIRFNQPAVIRQGPVSLSFPKGCFYRSFYFHLRKLPATTTGFSPVYAVHNRFVPVQKYFTLSLKIDSMPPKLKNKAYLAYAADSKDDFHYAGGKWNGNMLTAKVRALGNYTVLVDTLAPEIKPLNFGPEAKMTGKKGLWVKISDSQSGIKKYTATLNGHWILMEYDPKSEILHYVFDRYLKKGKNIFSLVVWDEVGNQSQYEAVIYN
jgi:hypothetical protein